MEYKRKVDKGRIPTCKIMGVNIAAIIALKKKYCTLLTTGL